MRLVVLVDRIGSRLIHVRGEINSTGFHPNMKIKDEVIKTLPLGVQSSELSRFILFLAVKIQKHRCVMFTV